jgi:hypothetical protein
MNPTTTEFPSLGDLTIGIKFVLTTDGRHTFDDLLIVAREPNAKMKTFLTEMVTCRLDGATELRLFCKYEAGRSHNSYGHRRGIAYEAEVYRRVLRSSRLATPRFYGAYCQAVTGDTWLILQSLDKRALPSNVRRDLHIDDDLTRLKYKLSLAARWIGQFHASYENCLPYSLTSFLNTYDEHYYRGWARRTSLFAQNLHRSYTWLGALCGRYQGLHLLSQPATVIHGEYYKHNIVHLQGAAYPVDWESAAIAPGEIDLASLIERWPAEIAQSCEAEYRDARWPEGAPADFCRNLDAARLYLQLRWLGDQPAWTTDEHRQWRFAELRAVGERLGLI